MGLGSQTGSDIIWRPTSCEQTNRCNKECLSALCHTAVTHGFCCVWKCQMLIAWATVCLEILHSNCFCCMWYLLCLEILHSYCFCCMWYLLCLEIMHSHWMSPLSLQQVAAFLLSLIGWVVCSGLEKKEASIFQMALNSFVILEINL